jgi:DNA-binding XRE family transcriptional regulator
MTEQAKTIHYLRQWRETRGLTQAQLAEQAKIEPETVRAMETEGKPISLELAVRLCRTLSLTLPQLLEQPVPS